MDPLEFILNGVAVRLDGVRPGLTLLDWLRRDAGLSGSKEGCAEGDCGACTVVLERVAVDGSPERVPVNACLTLLAQLDGLGIRTIEGLAGHAGLAHPLQRAFAEGAATQCGFCTPGLVMAGYAHLASGGSRQPDAIHDAVAGNLCRCTGYRPVVDAIALAEAGPIAMPALPTRSADRAFGPIEGQTVLAPRTLDALLALRAEHPSAWLMAGGTDLGLRVSVGRERPALILLTGFVRDLQELRRERDRLVVGASVPYARLMPWLTGGLAPVAELLRWLGSAQIRALGTLGGNLGTASPIGDSLPALVALGATVVLASAARGRRSVPVEEFLTGYRRTLLEPDEVIVSVELPEPGPGQRLWCHKVSKRRDQDIATVGAAFLVGIEHGRVVSCRLAFGAMADRVTRPIDAERALLGAPWTPEGIEPAARAIAAAFSPWNDVRGSAAYRSEVAANLLRRSVLDRDASAGSLERLEAINA